MHKTLIYFHVKQTLKRLNVALFKYTQMWGCMYVIPGRTSPPLNLSIQRSFRPFGRCLFMCTHSLKCRTSKVPIQVVATPTAHAHTHTHTHTCICIGNLQLQQQKQQQQHATASASASANNCQLTDSHSMQQQRQPK